MNIAYIILINVGLAICGFLIADVIFDRSGRDSMCAALIRTIKRAWLRHNIDGWQRDIEQIRSQRENDLRAEAFIAREIINAKAQLRDLG